MRPQQIRPTEVALVGVEPGGEAVDVSRGISTPTRACHGRKAHKRRRVLAWSTQERSSREITPVCIALESAKGPGAASVDSPLRYLRSKSVTRYTHGSSGQGAYPLMVKMLNLLSEDEVLKQSWASDAGLQAILVFDRPSDIRRQEALAVVYCGLGNGVVAVPGVGTGPKRPGIRKWAARSACVSQKRAHKEQCFGEMHLGLCGPRYWWYRLFARDEI